VLVLDQVDLHPAAHGPMSPALPHGGHCLDDSHPARWKRTSPGHTPPCGFLGDGGGGGDGVGSLHVNLQSAVNHGPVAFFAHWAVSGAQE
jgi:hypothetical protein